MSTPNLSEALRTHPPPFRPGGDQHIIFVELVGMIYHPSFRFQLPRISEAAWDTACGSIAEAERLEFLGDGAIGDAVGDIVVKLHPTGTPHMYSQIKSLLTCNAFFAQLMFKLDIANEGETTKEAADVFEAIIGLFKKERGTQGVEAWAWEYYSPMVEAAWEIWDEIKGSPRARRRYFVPHHEIQMSVEHRRIYLMAQAPPQPSGSGTKHDPFIIE